MPVTEDILNKNLNFAQLTTEERESFTKAPAPEHVRLPKGTRLYKWTSYPLIRWKQENGARIASISPFWSSMDGLTTPSGQVVESFSVLRKRFANTGGGVGAPRDFARATAAVSVEWNSMNAILFMQLDQEVWGYVGKAAGQTLHNRDKRGMPQDVADAMRQREKKVFWIGGAWQIVVPGLTEKHCHRIG